MDDMSGQTLDPFRFHGHPVSSITGLGGTGPLPDPTYAFHTAYVPVARGHAHFLVRFTNLQARRGSLLLRIHMLPDEPGAVAKLVTSHRVQLNWLAQHGGETRLRFEAFRGARYAIMGLVPDQLDASAEMLTIILDRPASEDDRAAVGDPRYTAYGSETIRTVSAPLLLSLEPCSFAQPVSQPCTTEQLQEPAFRKRCDTLSNLPADPMERWQVAYALQVLDRYGVLQDGARGLILGRQNHWVEHAVIAADASFYRVELDHTGGEAPVIDPADFPADLFAFDFLLSIRATDTLGNSRAAGGFIERVMECLRPNGLAVHLVGYHPDPSLLPSVAFDRNGLERVAFGLISRGHQTARLKPALTEHLSKGSLASAIPFGLIARRATLIR